MKKVLVDISLKIDKSKVDFENLSKEEMLALKNWKENGFLEQCLLKANQKGAVLLFNDIEETRLKELISSLPLHPFMENVCYTYLNKIL